MRTDKHLAAAFAALALSWLALALVLSSAHERGRWLAQGCNTDTDCDRMLSYMCSNGNLDMCGLEGEGAQ